ncbi:MAG: hypothetical protein A3I49_01685 [Candidatus Levybacteria bacterium RIFCSPLOWO2_02_FULL_37_11]|nr:MAG: hypothetical protein A3I49_01685 [Candidatus Levybacteria bacterium RIFCSPLOWO2_02_FULL_37_11]
MSRIYSLFIRLIRHELITGSFFIFIGGTIANFLAFILNLFFARNLSYSDYGILAALLSLFNLATIPAQSISAVIVRFASQFLFGNEEEKASSLFKKLFSLFTLLGAIAMVVMYVLSPSIGKFLRINDHFLVIVLVFTVVLNYLLTINLAFLNSLLRFKFISISGLLGGIVKLGIGVSLVLLGLSVYGALAAIIGMVVFQLILTLIPLKGLILKRVKEVKLPYREIINYSFPASLAIFSLFSFISSDVILVKHFYSETMAGLYGGLSLVGRTIFYFTAPIPYVMFPLLVKRHSGGKSYKNLLYLALVLVSVPSVLITLFYFLFPELTINIFLAGREYLTIASYLGLFGIFLTIFNINNVLVSFYLSLKDLKVSIYIFFCAVIQIILIYLFHQNFQTIILDSIASSSLLLGVLILYYIRHYFPRP